MASEKCVETGVAIAMASISGSRIIAWMSVVVLVAGWRLAASSSAFGLRSATVCIFASESSEKLRTRLGPQ